MTNDLRIAVDFDGNDWAGLYCDASDAPNLFAGTGVDISALFHSVSGSGTSETDNPFTLYGDDRAKYGKTYFAFTTGTDANPFIDIGYDGATYDLTGQTQGTYSLVLWAKLASGSSVNTFAAKIFSSGGDVAQSASMALNSTTWTKFTASGSWAGAARSLGLRLFRDSGTSNLVVHVAGAMILNGSATPAYFNCGAAAILLEPVTAYAMESTWDVGFSRAYQQVAPLGRAKVILTNEDKRFSPEYASGALFGSLNPGLLMQIGDPDYGIKGTYWTEDWKPLPGTSRAKTATLTATDARRFCDGVLPVWGLQETPDTDHVELLTILMGDIDIPGASLAGEDELPSDFEKDSLSFIHGYYPDFYGDDTIEGLDVTGVLGDIMESAQAHFWFNRLAQYDYGEASGDTSSPRETITDTDWVASDYGIDRVINSCDVTIYPKRQAGSATIWTLDKDITLAVGEAESFRITFRNTTGDKILCGADNLATSGFTLAVGTVPTHVTVGLSAVRAQSALLTLTNISGADRTVTAGNVTGDRVLALRTLIKSYEDATSIAAYGRQNLIINSKWVGERGWAKRVARWAVDRWKDPTYVMKWVMLNVGKSPQLAQDCYVGVSVQVTDTQTSHDRVYAIIGEQHSASVGLTNYTVRLLLEPMYDDLIWLTTP